MENGRYDQPRTAQSGRPLLGATHTLSLGSLSALGITLLGRIADVNAGGALVIADDLAANAAHADKVSADIRREIDDYIARRGIDAEPATVDPAEAMPARFPTPPIRELDHAAHGITTVISPRGRQGCAVSGRASRSRPGRSPTDALVGDDAHDRALADDRAFQRR